jgi:hypothetical protein
MFAIAALYSSLDFAASVMSPAEILCIYFAGSFSPHAVKTIIVKPRGTTFDDSTDVFATAFAQDIATEIARPGNFANVAQKLIQSRLRAAREELANVKKKHDSDPSYATRIHSLESMVEALSHVPPGSIWVDGTAKREMFSAGRTTIEPNDTRYSELWRMLEAGRFRSIHRQAPELAKLRDSSRADIKEGYRSLSNTMFNDRSVEIFLREAPPGSGNVTRVSRENRFDPHVNVITLFSVVRNPISGVYDIGPTEMLSSPRLQRLVSRYLETLWSRAITTTNDRQAAEAIAELEFVFIGPNPSGRAGASTGDALSLILQKTRGYKLRDSFEHVDFGVLSSLDLTEYVAARSEALLSLKNK